MNLILKISGLMIIAAGILLTFRPELVNPSASQYIGYEMIERRVRWGALIGLGSFLFLFQQWGHWWLTIWALLAALALGIMVARLIGTFMDGFFMKQFFWLMIELIVGAIFALLYWRLARQ